MIDKIVLEGARRMPAAALEAEVNSYLAEPADARDEAGRRLVVRSGFHQSRQIATSAGAVEVKVPRVNDKRVDAETGERKRFSSTVLPPWARKTPKISEVLPLLYLHGPSTGDFVPALEQFLGSTAGLSAATVSRLTKTWQDDHKAFQKRDLSATDFVYAWADGVHLRIRLDEGYLESSESWGSLLRDAERRGMRAPMLAVGDGALGFWKALREVFPDTREKRCRVHKTAHVLDSMPKSAQPAAKTATAGIYNAEDKDQAAKAVGAFARQYGAKFPKAVKKIVDNQDVLLAFYGFPAEHWIHLRTTNPIEATFATVRLRTKVTRGAGSRAVNAPHLVALVRAGTRFERGILVEREEITAA